MTNHFVVKTPDDWRVLREYEAAVVLDPTATRVAELFLQGRRKAGDAAWAAIRTNLSSLATFVDSLVLYEYLPLFDYALTFPRPPEEVIGDLALCEPVVIPVTVQYGAYTDIQLAAVEAMKRGAPIPAAVSSRIRSELDALNWTYESRLFGDDLSVTRAAGDPSGDKRVNSFLYVGLLFAGYAQELSGIHIVPPNLSALQLAAAIAPVGDAPLNEAVLFEKLETLWNATPNDLVRTLRLERPSFLPYLLTFDDPTPQRLFQRALALRNKAAVRDYREWLRELRDDLDKGRISDVKRKDIDTIAAKFARQVAPPRANDPVTVGVQLSVTGPSVGVSKEIDLARLRDWLLSLRPGKRYQKLLLNLSLAQASYFAIDRHLQRLWADS